MQVGSGKFDPKGNPYFGKVTELDGKGSCSAVVDPDKVTKYFKDPNGVWPEAEFIATENSGKTSTTGSRGSGRSRGAWKTWSFTRFTSERWATGRRGRVRSGRHRTPRLPCRAGRQRRRVAADGRIRRRGKLGLRFVSLFRDRVQRRRPGQGEVLHQGVPSPGHRRHRRRRLQPFHSRWRASRMDVRYRPEREEFYYWYEGRRPTTPIQPSCESAGQPTGRARRLLGQHVHGVRTTVLRRDGAQDVRQQRGHSGRGIPHRRFPRRPDDLDPRLQRLHAEAGPRRMPTGSGPRCSGSGRVPCCWSTPRSC